MGSGYSIDPRDIIDNRFYVFIQALFKKDVLFLQMWAPFDGVVSILTLSLNRKSKAIPVAGLGGP
jgi:hypothetical protein